MSDDARIADYPRDVSGRCFYCGDDHDPSMLRWKPPCAQILIDAANRLYPGAVKWRPTSRPKRIPTLDSAEAP